MGGESLIRLHLRAQRSLLYLNNSGRNFSLKLTPWASEFIPCPVVSHYQERISTIAQSKNSKISGWDSPFLPKAWNSRRVLLSICSGFSQAHFGYSRPRKPSEIRIHYGGSDWWRWMTVNQELMRIAEIQPISPGDLCGHPSFPPSAPNLDPCPERQKTNASILKVHPGEMPLSCIIVQNCREKHFFPS